MNAYVTHKYADDDDDDDVDDGGDDECMTC